MKIGKKKGWIFHIQWKKNDEMQQGEHFITI
jgi:hypothetical protein